MGNCADRNVVTSNKQKQMIFDIHILSGKWNSHTISK